MAITKINKIKAVLSELKEVRASLEPLKAKEKALTETVKAYLLENGLESLTNAQCTAVLRHTPKFKVSNENEALALAKLLKIDCLKVDGRKFADGLLEIDSNTDLSLYGKEVEEIAVRVTYRKK